MQVYFANICFIINICIIPYMHFQQYSLRNKISFKISFQCSLKLFGQKVPWNFLQSSMELFEQHLNNICGSMEFHGILSRSKVPWNSMELFPHSRVPWNSMELLIFPKKVPWNSMEFHGTFFEVPWNSMEFHGTFNFPQKSSMEFHGIPWNFFWSSMEFHGIPWNLINFIFKKIIFLNIVFGIWLMIRCYLAKISQKRYKLHWFQYRNSYFEHPSVSENGTRSAKMACCFIHWLIFPYPSGLLHWHCGNLTIAPVPAKQPWWIWINTSSEFIMNDCITTTTQSTTKPCAYILGYTVHRINPQCVGSGLLWYICR